MVKGTKVALLDGAFMESKEKQRMKLVAEVGDAGLAHLLRDASTEETSSQSMS
jgi:hypothetical protein